MPTLEDTLAFIKHAHEGQTDKAGNPYWLHPLDVMHRLGPDATEHEKLAALLHDVIEDTAYTADDLRGMGYPADVADVVEAVALVSRPKGDDRPTYLDWIYSIAATGNRIAIKVKIADNEANSDPERVKQLPPDRRYVAKRYERSLRILRAA